MLEKTQIFEKNNKPIFTDFMSKTHWLGHLQYGQNSPLKIMQSVYLTFLSS